MVRTHRLALATSADVRQATQVRAKAGGAIRGPEARAVSATAAERHSAVPVEQDHGGHPAMKITADKVREMQAWCAKSGVSYVNETSYNSAVRMRMRMAIKNRNRTPNGVTYYFPRVMPSGFENSPLGQARRKRAYVLWAGESVDAIEEACAFIVMGHNRTDIFLIRVSDASHAAMEIEHAHN